MKLKLAVIVYSFAIFLQACKGKTEVPPAFRNGIQIESKIFKVKQAYLVFNDSVKLGEDNLAALGQHVNLELVIDSTGWSVENGLFYPGISEKIESDDGNHVFENADLMSAHPTGVPIEDGWLVRIQAVINTIDKHYKYFQVTFHVWDKKGKGEIKGSYMLHVK